MKNLNYFNTKMKLFLAGFCLCIATSYAEVPQKINYQTVVRNSSGILISNANIGVRISILQGTANGPTVYNETQVIATNTNGLATLEIGSGATFANIDWFAGPYFIKTQIDPAGGTNYTITGTSPLLSVPYSFQAATLKVPNLSANQDDGKIGNSLFAPGLNIVGINNDNTDRKIQLWGGITQNVNSSGNLFAGNTTFAGKLSVDGGVIQNGGATITTTNDLGLYSTNSNWMRFVTNAAPIKFYTDFAIGSNATSGTPAMAISGSFLGVNVDGPSSDIHIVQTTGGAAAQGTAGITLQRPSAGPAWRIYNSGNFVRYNYASDGVTYAAKAYVGDADGSWNQVSDERLKRDLETFEPVISKVLALKPLKYHYNDNNETAQKSMGFLAQEVQKLFPEIVSHEAGEDLLGIDYSKFAVVSIKAIQEQQAQIEELKKQIAELNAAVKKINK